MNNDADLSIIALTARVVDTTEGDGVSAASLDVAFVAISSLRVHGALSVDTGHIRDLAVTQVVRIARSHCDTQCTAVMQAIHIHLV